MFIIKQWDTGHFILNSALGLKDRVEQIQEEMRAVNGGAELDLIHKVWDIDSMYPSMPKEDMVCALRTILKEVKDAQRLRVSHITVPTSKSLPVRWGKHYREEGYQKAITLPLDELVKIAKFSLEHCLTKIGGGTIVRQVHGIPMGDSLSPALAIGTCAWFERKWLNKLPEGERWRVQGVRYLDDVMMIVNDAGWGKGKETLANFEKRGSCYPKQLSLSGDDEKHYLECIIHNKKESITVQHWNKNEGSDEKQRFYKGAHANSFSDERFKTGAMIGTFTRIARNSSTGELLRASLKEKIRELKFLGYKEVQIMKVLRHMKKKFPQGEWGILESGGEG